MPHFKPVLCLLDNRDLHTPIPEVRIVGPYCTGARTSAGKGAAHDFFSKLDQFFFLRHALYFTRRLPLLQARRRPGFHQLSGARGSDPFSLEKSSVS